MADGAEDLRLWDAAASGYADRADSFYRRVHGFLWDRLGTVQGLDVLDLGCGDGWLAEEMRLAGARVTGIDGSATLLAQARSRYPQVLFEQRDLVLGLPHPHRARDLMHAPARSAIGIESRSAVGVVTPAPGSLPAELAKDRRRVRADLEIT